MRPPTYLYDNLDALCVMKMIDLTLNCSWKKQLTVNVIIALLYLIFALHMYYIVTFIFYALIYNLKEVLIDYLKL